MTHPVEAAAQAAFTATSCFNTIRETKNIKLIKAELSATADALSSVISDLEENHKRKFIKMRKGLRSLSNVVEGLREGVNTRTIGHNAVRETCDLATKKFLPSLAGVIKEEISKRSSEPSKAAQRREQEAERELNSQQKRTLRVLQGSVSASAISAAVESMDAVVTSSEIQKKIRRMSLQKPGATAEEKRAFDDARDRLEQLDHLVRIMASDMKAGFKIYKMPTIPIFKKNVFLNVQDCKSAGIMAQDLEGYTVMFNQPVLAIRKSYAEKLGYTLDKFAEFAEVILEMVRERSGTSLQLVSPKYRLNPSSSDIIMFWTMPPKQLTVFADRLARGATGDMSWDFPTLS